MWWRLRVGAQRSTSIPVTSNGRVMALSSAVKHWYTILLISKQVQWKKLSVFMTSRCVMGLSGKHWWVILASYTTYLLFSNASTKVGMRFLPGREPFFWGVGGIVDISSSRLGVSVSVPFSEISGADGLRVYLLGYQSSSVGFWGPSRSIISFSHGEAILLTQLADTGAPARETGQRQSDRENWNTRQYCGLLPRACAYVHVAS